MRTVVEPADVHFDSVTVAPIAKNGCATGLSALLPAFASDWLFKVHAPFWSESFRYTERTVDLAGRRDAIHFSATPARVCFRCCEFCCRRQAWWNDLLGLAGPPFSADRCAALFDGDETTISAAAAVIDSTPFIGISTGRAGREEH